MKEQPAIYMVRNAAGISCSSSAPFLGYSLETLQALEQDGFILHINNSPVKYPSAAEWKRSQKDPRQRKE